MAKEPVYYLKFMLPGRVTPYAGKLPNDKQRALQVTGSGRFILPVDKWLPRREPVPCQSGYHFCRNVFDLPDWFSGGEIWLVEIRGKRVDTDNKACAAQMKLAKQIELSQDEFWNLRRDACQFREMAASRTTRWRWGSWELDDVSGRMHYVQQQGPPPPPFKHLNRTKFVRGLNKILARNGITKWGDQ
jgi:hypothetical protein